MDHGEIMCAYGKESKIAVCFFGQVKNYTDKIYSNYLDNIFSSISSYGIDYYLVTYNNKSIFNPKNKENDKIDYTSIFRYIDFAKSLILSIDSPQTESIDRFSDYLVKTYGGSWGDNSNISTRNGIRQIYALKNLYNIIDTDYQKYILLRPDLFYIETLDAKLLESSSDIIVPLFDSYGGYNDRFAITNNIGLKVYCSRYDNLCKNPLKYHSENYLKKICDNYEIVVEKNNNLNFKRIRANGNLQ